MLSRQLLCLRAMHELLLPLSPRLFMLLCCCSPRLPCLQWAPDDRQLASGGNDNQLLIWQPGSAQPLSRFTEHTAAVKAIAWSPHQHGLLASGGGTADRCIRFWNTSTNSLLSCVDTGSQVGSADHACAQINLCLALLGCVVSQYHMLLHGRCDNLGSIYVAEAALSTAWCTIATCSAGLWLHFGTSNSLGRESCTQRACGWRWAVAVVQGLLKP